MDKEDFLLLRVVEASEEELPHVEALYFLKILSKLESCGRPDVVVDVADAAIKTLVASGNETNVSTLYSLLFRHHLDAGHIYVSGTCFTQIKKAAVDLVLKTSAISVANSMT